MSNSLVYKSLELLGYEDNIHKEKKKKKKKNKCKNIEYKGILNLIPTKHRIISKQDGKDISNILKRTSKVTVYETKKHLATKQDSTNEKVQLLLSLSNNRINPDIANEVLYRAMKKKYTFKQEKLDKPKETVFTEEDFKKFEQEYTG